MMRERGIVAVKQFFAHTLADRPIEDWQLLEHHLHQVGKIAAKFGLAFGAEDWTALAGRWHDLGKYSDAFQHYLRSSSMPDPQIGDSAAKTDHSTAGAQHAVNSIDVLGHILAYVIAGHHSGLLDGRSAGSCLESRLLKKVEQWDHVSSIPISVTDLNLPIYLRNAFDKKDAFAIAMFTRMIFSCLVDADFLDTERFMAPELAEQRQVWPGDVLLKMEAALTDFVRNIRSDENLVNHARAEVRRACIDAAELSPGLFSLTVPTGGGKTLSSLAFALRHAVRHGLKRIIYVIPFTSIIEQNAAEFRKVMTPLRVSDCGDPVLEHHCNLDVGEAETVRSRLATENWDAPLIVTTSVQFYESLFANRTSRCRKLHNMAEAVIILDEVQTIPVSLLEPCMRVLQELSQSYRASIVLCTATQPALRYRKGFPDGFRKVREIIPDPRKLYRSLKRVEVVDIGEQADQEIVERLREENQVLCIVNTRRHARVLFDELDESQTKHHLSASMCPVHRSEKLAEIRKALERREECRVISTQLIEAGVDIDFPTVFRSRAGLDSIAQAAGRCNRNGELSEKGRTYVFQSEHVRSERYFADTTNVAAQVLEMYDDPLSLDAVEHYFKLYYWDQSTRWDEKKILKDFLLHSNDRSLPFSFSFAQVAKKFRLIENEGRAVIIPWGEVGTRLCDKLRGARYGLPNQQLLHKLQRYTVQVPLHIWNKHAGRSIELVHERFPVLISPEMHYSRHVGLNLETESTTLLQI